MNRRAERAARVVARVGLVARTGFYLLLAGLVVGVAVAHGHGGRQANANGALALIARNPAGMFAIVAAAVGFFVFGVVRIGGAVRAHEVDRWRRVTTSLQGVFYVGLTWVPLSFALGHRQTGSEQQQHAETAMVFGWPFGRELVAAVGVLFVVVCIWQIRTGLSRDFTDGLDLGGCSRRIRRGVKIVGTTGIVARALVFVPIGVFLVVAAVQANPRHANGLDALLADVARQAWGPAVLALVALGLVVFAAYSGIEARFREVESGV